MHGRERIVTEGLAVGNRFFSETQWSSALRRENLPRIRTFLEGNGFTGVDVALSVPVEDSIRMRWALYYRQDGAGSVLAHDVPIPAGSNFLKLTIGYQNESERDRGDDRITVIGNAIHLMFGVPAARERILTGHFDAQNMDGTFSDVGFNSRFDGQHLHFYDEPPIQGAKLRALSDEASILLGKAFEQRFGHERFILMWLAFEAVINSHPGAGKNGEKRKRFFLTELGSDAANDEVKRLFKLGCDAFKEGEYRGVDFDAECWSLYGVFQLAVLDECPQRAAFLDGYERFLQARVA